ncbi:ribonuclease HI [Campylobacterota bacterium DY0563]
MKTIKLFCDGSVNPKTKIGFGSYFIYDESKDKQDIKIKNFFDTSSTKLEMEVLLWALEEKELENIKVYVYTDCQNILKLLDRREKLEKNNYLTSTGKMVNNTVLYKKFYLKYDNLDLEFIKVKGHKKSVLKDEIDKLFNLVDKASRKALREFNKKEEI